MRRIAILVLIASLAAAAEEPSLPAEVAALVTAYDGKVTKIQADSEIAINKETEALRAKLTKAQEALTKKGNLNAALAIKAKIDSLPKLSLMGEKEKDSIHSSRDVILYPEPDFKGTPVIVKIFNSAVNVWDVNFPNDALRSLKVPRGMSVVVSAGYVGAGPSYTVTEDCADLQAVTKVDVSSIKINNPAR